MFGLGTGLKAVPDRLQWLEFNWEWIIVRPLRPALQTLARTVANGWLEPILQYFCNAANVSFPKLSVTPLPDVVWVLPRCHARSTHGGARHCLNVPLLERPYDQK